MIMTKVPSLMWSSSFIEEYFTKVNGRRWTQGNDKSQLPHWPGELIVVPGYEMHVNYDILQQNLQTKTTLSMFLSI